MSQAPLPSEIQLHKQSRKLELVYDDKHYFLSAEFLRVHSPSAEVKGHGSGQEVLQIQKENVGINNIEPVGHYAIKIYFDDGHDSGLFSWDYLYNLCINRDNYWQKYLGKLMAEGYERQRDA
ncbi:gamma-butyrobetaine hydroxylase-like domain-containing protein [Methylophaga nitratireducenticrescens]|uniref:Uncharacterized protein n=1 Tax=Methylophaga nitratireducenticrescens TaxID=754476 RepID=I1XL74_METNJ|nr:DUF971 domain-containing protein [Methylophaga nitratireducenticrescens]AFI85143.1 1-(5-phosphoribosyl)-5-((5-phosphoribosylamino)methylideneamino)imidazole-4-carboxamide isomerase [Methylophaga nitratireducenticrescens]AUZ85631.1 1-(5-phosphoribosyl)-5-((5-phosphoribosylamino)methylideneamino)imidazole-4-carboxamide isomerase [Methylophaga nitratireducenticrescens]